MSTIPTTAGYYWARLSASEKAAFQIAFVHGDSPFFKVEVWELLGGAKIVEPWAVKEWGDKIECPHNLNFKERIVVEKQALDDKARKLELFIASDKFDTLYEDNRVLLREQLVLMEKYSSVLHQRLGVIG